MRRSRMRPFRPFVDRLESICLLSAGLKPPAVVHAMAVVDLKGTPVGADALTALRNSTPSSGRQKLVVNSLTADDSTNTVSGRATGLYKFSFIGSITATISFKTSIEAPRVKDVQVSVNKFSSFILKGSTKLKVQKAVVQFLNQDRDQIVAALHPTVA